MLKMTPGKYLLIVSTVYLICGIGLVLFNQSDNVIIVQLLYLFCLITPMVIRPLGRKIGFRS